MENFDEIEDIFRNQLGNSQIDPPSDLWGKLDQSIEDASFENLFKKKLSKAEEKPPRSIWAALQFKLWMKSFLQFSPAQFNVYYAAASLAVATTGLVAYFSEPNEATVEQIVIEESAPILEEVVSTGPVEDAVVLAVPEKEEEQIVVEHEAPVAEAVDVSVPVPVEPESVEPVPALPLDEPAVEKTADLVKIDIVGQTEICQNVSETYKAKVDASIVNADYQWEVDDRFGEIEKVTSEVVTVKWFKAGKTEIACTFNNGEQTTKGAMPIVVKERPDAEFVGKDELCQGAESVAYYLKFKNRIDYEYIWEIKGNDDFIRPHKARVDVNWNTPGEFVVAAEAIHPNGCRLELDKKVLVHKNPVAAFDTQKSVANEVTFFNRSVNEVNTQKGLKYVWEIDGEKFTEKSPQLSFNEDGQIVAMLHVTDEHACTDSKRQVMFIKVYTIQLDKAFKPDYGDAFIPRSKGLLKYKIEIFDLKHNKIWESTELVDGEPAVGWDGTVNGEPMPRGNYKWEVEAVFEDGTHWEGVPDNNGNFRKWGSIELIR